MNTNTIPRGQSILGPHSEGVASSSSLPIIAGNPQQERQSESATLDDPSILIDHDDLAKRFGKYFKFGWNAIHKLGNQWRTFKGKKGKKICINPRQIWRDWANPEKIIGLRFGKTTRYCVIDVDAGSRYHLNKSRTNWRSLFEALESIGIYSTVVVRSSESGGCHIYAFFDRPIPSFPLACLLREAFWQNGIEVSPGQVEIFPNRKTYGQVEKTNYNGHRLPCQKGSFVDGLAQYPPNPYLTQTAETPQEQKIEEFLALAEISTTFNQTQAVEGNIAEGIERIPSIQELAAIACEAFKKSNYIKGNGSYKGRLKEWKEDIDTTLEQGFTDRGQTNQLLGVLGQLGRVFLGYDDEKQFAEFISDRASALPGFLQWCGHIAEIPQRALSWARSAIAHYYPAGTKAKKGQVSAKHWETKHHPTNELRKQTARTKIQDAMALLSERPQGLPQGITARAKAIKEMCAQLWGGISDRTLYQEEHKKLWHPKFTGECKIPEPASDTEISPPQPEKPSQSPEPAPDKEFYTTPLYEGCETASLPARPSEAEARDGQSHSGRGVRGEQNPSNPDEPKDSANEEEQAISAVAKDEERATPSRPEIEAASTRGQLAILKVRHLKAAGQFAKSASRFGGEVCQAVPNAAVRVLESIGRKLYFWRNVPELRPEIEEWLQGRSPEIQCLFYGW